MEYQYEKDNKERVPFEHYRDEFSRIDPIEASKRTHLPYDEQNHRFQIRLMYEEYYVQYPSGVVTKKATGEVEEDYPTRIFFLRYFIEGIFYPSTGKQLTYREIPWGEVYFKNFQGRCLARLAFGFGFNLQKFDEVMSELGAQKISMGDVGYKFEFINDTYVTFILWAGDDEFPPSSQILFEDNIAKTFRAEDCAVIGDISIGKIKQLAKQK